MTDWRNLKDAFARIGPAVLVLVAQSRGSAPRDSGTVMLVGRDSTNGTIGGGTVEHRAIGIARDILDGAQDRVEVDFPLGPALDQCCGGHMRLAFARVDQIPETPFDLWPGGPVVPDPDPAPEVIIYGAGHVGRAVVAAMAPLPWRLTWVDTRAGLMAHAPEGIDCVETPLPEAVVETADTAAFHLIMTQSHAVDLEIAAAVLARRHGFCGLIGSATKRATFARRLAERGLSGHAISQLTCPIGLTGVRDKRPAVIAASATAQLLQIQAAASARSRQAG